MASLTFVVSRFPNRRYEEDGMTPVAFRGMKLNKDGKPSDEEVEFFPILWQGQSADFQFWRC